MCVTFFPVRVVMGNSPPYELVQRPSTYRSSLPKSRLVSATSLQRRPSTESTNADAVQNQRKCINFAKFLHCSAMFAAARSSQAQHYPVTYPVVCSRHPSSKRSAILCRPALQPCALCACAMRPCRSAASTCKTRS